MELRNTNSQQTRVCDQIDAALEETRVREKHRLWWEVTKECLKDNRTVSRRTVTGILITRKSSCLQNSC